MMATSARTAQRARFIDWLFAIAVRAGGTALVWGAVTEGASASWGAGALAVVGATGMSLMLAPPRGGKPLALWPMLCFAAYFIAHTTRAGVQVALLALHPRLPLAPACLEIPLRLPPGGARNLLLYVCTLMPGSLCVSVGATSMRVHVLDRRLAHGAAVRALETRIAAIWRLTP